MGRKKQVEFESAQEADEFVEVPELGEEKAEQPEPQPEQASTETDEFVIVTWLSGHLSGKSQRMRKSAAEIYKAKGKVE